MLQLYELKFQLSVIMSFSKGKRKGKSGYASLDISKVA